MTGLETIANDMQDIQQFHASGAVTIETITALIAASAGFLAAATNFLPRLKDFLGEATCKIKGHFTK